MRKILFVFCFVFLIIAISCTPQQALIPAEEHPFSETIIRTVTVAPTQDIYPTPMITATPITSTDDISVLLQNPFGWPCIGNNIVERPSDIYTPANVEFIPSNIEPDSQKYWISELADSADKSQQAYVGCAPEFCQQKVYVKDSQSNIYEVNWDKRLPWRSIQRIVWIYNNTLAFYQSASPSYGEILAVNTQTRELVYEASVFPDFSCLTPTPIP